MQTISRHLRAAAWPAAAVALALAVRLPRTLAGDFPINDGGFTMAMAGQLAANGLVVPLYASFNDGRIPFAYPPLALYAAAATHLATGVSLPQLMRLLPLLANLATVVAVFFLGRRILGSSRGGGIAALVFAVLPRSYEWLIMGGGLTRSFGLLFACLGLICGHRVFVERRRNAVLGASACLGFAILSHPEMGVFALASLGLLVLAGGIDRWRLARAFEILAGAALLATPWVASVLLRHGSAPFLAAAHTSDFWLRGSLARLFTPDLTGEIGLPLLACLAWLGLLLSIAWGDFLPSLWLLTAFVAVARSAPTPATVPLALLVAYALVRAILPGIGKLPRGSTDPGALTGVIRRRRAAECLIVMCVLAVPLYFSNLRRTPDDWRATRCLAPAERDAMAWVAANTPVGSRFVVAPSSALWATDAADAWFPVLAGRVSVATPAGAEWIPGGEFRKRVSAYARLARCGVVDARCLDAATEPLGVSFSHVYVSKTPTSGTTGTGKRAASSGEPDFQLVYDGPGAAVYARR